MDGCFVTMVNDTHVRNSVTKDTATMVGGQHRPSMRGLEAGFDILIPSVCIETSSLNL